MIRELLRWTGISLACLAAFLFALLILVGGPQSIYQSVNRGDFEAEAWREGDIRTRGLMVGDLIDRGLLTVTKREEVVALLGPPDYERADALLYTLDIGTRWGSTVWTYQLHVNFDGETGRTTSVFYAD